MHGISQGIIQGVSGGNAEQSFVTAAITSIAGSGFSMTGSLGSSPVGQSLFGAVVGGSVSNMQGGNFWEGAAIGLTVGLLNHAGKPLSKAIDRWLSGPTTVAGIYGAGGKNDSGNPELETEVLKRGGKMFQSSWPWGNGDSEIIAYLKAGFLKGHRLIIYAHSRGGAAAVRIANDLFGMHINISEINLYDPVGLYGGGDLVFKYPNVMKVNNYYQRNPTNHILYGLFHKLASNPFQGSPVSGNFQWPVINNVNYTGAYYSTGVLMNHLNITDHAINRR